VLTHGCQAVACTTGHHFNDGIMDIRRVAPIRSHRTCNMNLHRELNDGPCVQGPMQFSAVRAAAIGTIVASMRVGRNRKPKSLPVRFVGQYAKPDRRDAPEKLRVLLLGGAGRIGTAAAIHLAQSVQGPIQLILAGRDENRGSAALQEVRQETASTVGQGGHADRDLDLSFCKVDWTLPGALSTLLQESPVDAVLHTAGPFDGDTGADVLKAVISCGVPVYVDVADPICYIDAAKAMATEAKQNGTMALVSAGAFPGFSNVLAIECARRLVPMQDSSSKVHVQDIDFSYFTAGLGGSGAVNLLITNLGFGEPVPVFRDGKYSPEMSAGSQSRQVKFYTDSSDPACEFVGEREVWSWPFPEAATVARHLQIRGDSSTGMGTAPGVWNTILVALVALVPRDLWQARWFSEGLAWFSLPLVWFTDLFVKETHAIKVEVTASDGRKAVAVQTHKSFRRCVGQSTAEFTLDLLERFARKNEDVVPWMPGVWLPEEIADNEAWRPGLLDRLSRTPGTVSCNVKSV